MIADRRCHDSRGRPKFRYPTRADAKAVARRAGLELQPYRCPVCGYFHLGHYPANPRSRRRLRRAHR